jgi:hypothetical protein
MMYADVYVREPLEKVLEDWDFLSERVLPRFLGPIGDHVFGIRRLVHETPARTNPNAPGTGPVSTRTHRQHLEIGPAGVIKIRRRPLIAHVTCAGTPHHTESVYGYWHINDMDEISIDLPATADGPGYVILIQGHPHGREADRIAWYCQQCTQQVHFGELVTGTVGFEDFWKWERTTVRQYNADARLRTCWNCGHINPLGYCGFASLDTPEERQSRLLW